MQTNTFHVVNTCRAPPSNAYHPPLQVTPIRQLYAHPPMIIGPTAPVETEAPCARLTETMEVLKMAGNPEKAPAKSPRPLELNQLVTQIHRAAVRPRSRCVYHSTLWCPLGVGARDQHSMKPTTTQISMMMMEKVQIFMPILAAISSSQETKTAAINQAIIDTTRVRNVTFVLLIRFSKRAGKTFQMGRKIRFVARIPSHLRETRNLPMGAAKRDSACSRRERPVSVRKM